MRCVAVMSMPCVRLTRMTSGRFSNLPALEGAIVRGIFPLGCNIFASLHAFGSFRHRERERSNRAINWHFHRIFKQSLFF
jgi:hypothetical protein